MYCWLSATLYRLRHLWIFLLKSHLPPVKIPWPQLIEKWIYLLRHLLIALVKSHLPTVKTCPPKQIVKLIVNNFVSFKTPSDLAVKFTSSICQNFISINLLTFGCWYSNLCHLRHPLISGLTPHLPSVKNNWALLIVN